MNFKMGLLGIITLISTHLSAQTLKVEGDLSKVKGVSSIDIQFDYSNMSVGKFDKEEDYLTKRVNERNEKKPGDGDQWREAWFADRENRFEPSFEEVLGNSLKKHDIKVAKNLNDAPVTIKVHTYFTEPGFNVGVWKKPAYINADVIFIDNSDGTVLGTMKFTKVNSRNTNADYDAGFRIELAYITLSKLVGSHLRRKVLK
ncbi:hypothetical protein LVD15_23095 [Fulvivirga maritima]|uniref:hypothetical protein n=1 Tax=Fulvivirga maritima TaxID=2904247 RepID=UPI001F381624|nr:hypothetical protein [Fulvivirga maritima]UII26156.1 hypothetical protein LVD15_23095 [Fulvivirga maritima]